MTITDNGRIEVGEDLVARGRELVAGGRMPPKRKLQEHLGVGWPKVNAVLARLAEEQEKRRREARAAIRRLPSRKRQGAPTPIHRPRFQAVNEITAAAPAPPPAEPVAASAPEAVQERPAAPVRRPVTWPLVLLALPAFAAVWSGWVGLGGLTGFGVVQPFPGIPGLSSVRLDTAITLPIGVETYGAYALYVWLSGHALTKLAKGFAMWSALGSLAFGAAGQVAYHRMVAAGMTHAPWQITTVVSCLPVLVLGMGAALRHLVHAND